MKKALTAKQEKVFSILKTYIEKERRSPTLEELRQTLKVRSMRTVTQYLDSLERKGYILRRKNAKRNIELLESSAGLPNTVSVPVIASVGCDDLSLFAQDTENCDEFLEVDRSLAQAPSEIVAVRAIGDSMNDAGIESGDYILIQFTDNVETGDRVAAVVNEMVVVKRLEKREGLLILWPESKDPKYKPIILSDNYKITGKVLCVIPNPSAEVTEIVYEI